MSIPYSVQQQSMPAGNSVIPPEQQQLPQPTPVNVSTAAGNQSVPTPVSSQPVSSSNPATAPSFPSEAELRERVKETNSGTNAGQNMTMMQQPGLPPSASSQTAPAPMTSVPPSSMPVNDGQYVNAYPNSGAMYPPPMNSYQTSPYQPAAYDQASYQRQYESQYQPPPYQPQYQPPQYQPQYQPSPYQLQYQPPQYQPQYEAPQYQQQYQPPQYLQQYQPPQYQQQYQPPQYQQQPPQQQVACPSCNTKLVPPAGAEIFKCPCGQVMRNPYVASSSTGMSQEEMKKKKQSQNMKDAGLGIGIGLAGAAVLGAFLASN